MKRNRIILCFCTASVLILSGILLSTSNGKTLNTSKNAHPKITDTSFTIVFGGDLMGHQPLNSAAWNDSTKQYEYDKWFQFIQPYLNSADYTFANLEVTLAGEPYTGYPQFSSPDSYAKAMKDAGIDFLFTANNHSQDRGKAGIERTIDVLDKFGILHTGTFKDTISRTNSYPFLINIKGCKLAFLNYTYGTNGLRVSAPNFVNIIDTQCIFNDIKIAEEKQVDAIVSVMHWGLEYMITENQEQREIATKLAKRGVSAIIGMHPHVVQPIKNIRSFNRKLKDSVNVPVAYSLGNLISNQRDINQDGGILVKLHFSKQNGVLKIIDVDYLPFWVWRLNENNLALGFKRGYYIVTKKELHLLKDEDKIKADLFFKNVKSILGTAKEWMTSKEK